MDMFIGLIIFCVGAHMIARSPVPNDEETLTELWRKIYNQRQEA